MTPILIIGMARSGTTLISHILGSLPGVHMEVEPHALWKSGNFKYFNDEEFDASPKIIENIRTKLFKRAGEKILIEKSPNNSLHPALVHAAFPEARIVFIQRDPVLCIHSNYKRSLTQDSFKLSIILKKYFVYTGSKDLDGAISNFKLYNQLSTGDWPDFMRYTLHMFSLRKKNLLPFGPKLKDFETIVKEKGLLAYHCEVFKKSEEYKAAYQTAYQNQIAFFSLENIMNDMDEIKRLVNFTQIPVQDSWFTSIRGTFDAERVKQSQEKSDIEQQIIKLL
ncbi:MAG: sulfotransferase [Bacteroidetes bacterium]|nr:sulfotransferase [Bacteroidota bacterium]